MKIALTGGGTAGHVMPNLALLPNLKKHFDQIVYIGGSGMEKTLVKELPFFEIPTVKLERKLTPANLCIPFRLAKSVRAAKKILREQRPNVVFSKGGYVGLPVVLAARKLGIPVVVHESDMTLGLANRLSKNAADYVCTAFSDTAHALPNGIFTGTPIRRELAFGSKAKALSECGFTGGRAILLVTGGSLGARFLNDLVRRNLDALLEEFDVLHLCGRGNLDPALRRKGYYQAEFCDHMEDFYAAAECIVSRAGSNTINEIAYLQKPALLIPLPKGNSRGDQIENAKYFEKLGLSLVLFQEDAAHFVPSVSKLRREKPRLVENMRRYDTRNACEKITKILLDCTRKKD